MMSQQFVQKDLCLALLLYILFSILSISILYYKKKEIIVTLLGLYN